MKRLVASSLLMGFLVAAPLSSADEERRPNFILINCDDLGYGDLHWATVHWGGKAELGKKVGEPITLRFRLDKADLYGIEFE